MGQADLNRPPEIPPPPGAWPPHVLPYQPPGYGGYPGYPVYGPHPIDLRRRDDEHLRLLALFHYIGGGLLIAFSSIFIIHIVMGIALARNPGFFNATPTGTGTATSATAPTPPPFQPMPAPFMGWMFAITGSGAVLIGWTCGLLTIYSGRCIKRRRRRTFSLIVAGINCLHMPVGTLLGVFTFVVLLRESVAAQYLQAAAASPGATAPPVPPR